ncbi:MAG: hypothetical protein N4A43_02695 [Alphaproteobacteria bacterium]|jgi:hypothetical protein|nr:hypothetical protein [Alphaproteobacteria bacterium]
MSERVLTIAEVKKMKKRTAEKSKLIARTIKEYKDNLKDRNILREDLVEETINLITVHQGLFSSSRVPELFKDLIPEDIKEHRCVVEKGLEVCDCRRIPFLLDSLSDLFMSRGENEDLVVAGIEKHASGYADNFYEEVLERVLPLELLERSSVQYAMNRGFLKKYEEEYSFSEREHSIKYDKAKEVKPKLSFTSEAKRQLVLN